MIKLYLLPVVLLTSLRLFSQNYTVLGDATVLPGCNCYQLTPNQGGESGAVYENNTINLNNSFDFTFSNFFGCNTGNGADGEVFVLTTNPGGLGTGGGSMGYGGNTQPCSLGIEFDTYQNTGNGDPWYNHTGYESGGQMDHNVAAPVSATPTQGYTLEDCNWHTVEIVWNANTQTLSDYIDGSLRIQQALPNMVSTYLCGNAVVNWGWTAGTGGAWNLQEVCMRTISSWIAGNNYQSCSPTVQFTDVATSNTGNVTGWAWNFGDGGTSALQNPSHTYTDTGTYTATLVITEVSGCTDTFGHTVHIVAPITLTPTINQPLCYGDSGSIVLAESGGFGASAGDGGFVYTWSNGTQGPEDTNLAAGSYSVSVTDGVCSATGQYAVNQPALLTISALQTNVACFGQSTGTIHITPNGGTPTYTYTWSPNVSATGLANSLAAGAYAVTVTDLNNCSADSSFTITQPAQALSVNSSQTNLTCYGSNNGVARVVATGGTIPYSYVWVPGTSTADSATGLAAGNYVVLVADNNQCTDSANYIITQPAQIVITVDSVNVLCYGQSTGSIILNASGGTGTTYTYNWAPNVSTTNTALALAAGLYKITVTDANACTTQQSVNITQPTHPLSATCVTVNVACFGNSTGSINANVTGGTPVYAYSWSPNVSTTGSATNLDTGVYAVTITDINNCSIDSLFTITQPAQALTLVSSQTNLTCYESNNGVARAAVTGGTNPYNYVWTPGTSNTDSAAGLAAGNYEVVVTDNNHCQDSASYIITQPTQIVPIATIENVKCFNQPTGSISWSASGGTGNTYTYTWNPNVSSTSSATGLPAGNYTITVADAAACTVANSATVTQPQAFNLSATTTPVKCYNDDNGAINIIATGGTPTYSYIATNGTSTYNNNNTGQFTQLAVGAYTIVLTDQNNCTDSTTAVVGSPVPLTTTISSSSPTCSYLTNGTITALAAGGNPGYTFAGSNLASNTSGQFTGLAAGSYVISVTDTKGCDTTASVTLTAPDSLLVNVAPLSAQVKLGDTLQITTTTNQTGTVSYAWSPDFGLSCYNCADPVFNGVYTQPYNVIITNDSGCVANASIDITVIPNYDFFVPNAFTPNNDGKNDYWQLYGNTSTIKQLQVMVFDRVGEKVFESTDVNFMWDGTFKGQPAPMGVYVYTIKLVWLNDYTSNTITGSITLLK